MKRTTSNSVNYARFFALFFCISAMLLTVSCGGGSSTNTGISSYTISALVGDGSAPVTGADNCYPNIPFIVKDEDGNPVQNLNIEVNSSGFIAEHLVGDPLSCGSVAGASNLMLKTDDFGTIRVEIIVHPTVDGLAYYIQASSGAAVPAIWKTAASATP